MADTNWHKVCKLDDLEVNWGEVALIDGHQYAIFRLPDDSVYATNHEDPNSGALVIARGITGNKAGQPTIASPLYKEEYNLRTGEQLNGGDYRLPVYETKIENGDVLVNI